MSLLFAACKQSIKATLELKMTSEIYIIETLDITNQ